MPEGFRLEAHGLKKLRVDHFGPLVFGSLSSSAPPLGDYIGNLIGARIHRVLHGTPKVLGTTSQILHNNWKLYCENVRDTYHATLLHSFFTTFRISRLTAEGGVDIAENGAHHASYTRNKVDRVDAATSDQLYAGMPSMHENFRLADPNFFPPAPKSSATTPRPRSCRCSRISCCSRSRTRSPCGWCCRRRARGPNCNGVYIGFAEDDAKMTALRLPQANLVGVGRLRLDGGRCGRQFHPARDPRRRKRIRCSKWAGSSTSPRHPDDRGFGAQLLAGLSADDGVLSAVDLAEMARRLELEPLYTDYAALSPL